MKGTQAFELLNQDKMVCLESSNNYIYKMFDGFICQCDKNGNKINDTLFNFNLDYKEYKKDNGWHNVGDGNFYMICNDNFEVEEENSFHELEYPNHCRFSTKWKAQQVAFYNQLFQKLQRFSDENGGNEIDWNKSGQIKWSIEYSFSSECIVATCCYTYKGFGQVYFASEEIVKKAIELFHDELIKYFTYDWENEEQGK